MRRSTKYLNAREYAERLRLSENRDVQDFAEDFIEALDAQEEKDDNAEIIVEIEELIEEKCPEYAPDLALTEILEDMITRLRPKPVYDL